MTYINGNSPLTQDYSVMPNETQIAADFGGDANAQLAAMVFMFARERSKDASVQRDLTENTIQDSEALQIDKMHQQADAIRAAGWVQGLSQIASGVVGFATAGGTEAERAKGASMGKLFEGVGQLAATPFKGAEQDLQTDALEAGQDADASKRALEQINDNADEARDMKDRTLDFLQNITDGQAEADKALVSIRA